MLQTLDVRENFIEGLDNHAGNAAGVVDFAQKLQILEVFGGLELASKPRLSVRSRETKRSM